MNNKVVDGSLVVLGVLQIYSMFLPDVSSIGENDRTTLRQEEFHASAIVGGLTLAAFIMTKSFFIVIMALLTSAGMLAMYEYAIRRNCGCGGET